MFCALPGVMLIAWSATTAWARAVAHHRSIEAAPFSSISSIGMRFDPRIGAASSIKVVPNGNESSAEAAGSDAAKTSSTGKARQDSMNINSPHPSRGAHEKGSPQQGVEFDRYQGL